MFNGEKLTEGRAKNDYCNVPGSSKANGRKIKVGWAEFSTLS
jgi:hypothetical protein